MKAKILFLISLLLSVYSASAMEWEEIRVYNNSDISGDIKGFYKNGNKIYLSNQGIIRSTDGGETYTDVNRLIDDNGNERDISEIDTTVWHLFGTDSGRIFARFFYGKMIMSSDDGETWTYTDLPAGTYDRYTFVESTNELYALINLWKDGANLLYLSSDGGKKWSQVDIEEYGIDTLKKFYLTPDSRLLLFGCKAAEKNNMIFIDPTTKQTTTVELEQDINDIYVTDAGIFCFDSLKSEIKKTDDDGKTWQTLVNLEDEIQKNPYYGDYQFSKNFGTFETHKNTVYCFNKVEGLPSFHPYIFFSFDSGLTWDLTVAVVINSREYHVFDGDIYKFYSSNTNQVKKLNRETHFLEQIFFKYQFYHMLQFNDMGGSVKAKMDKGFRPLWIEKDDKMGSVKEVDDAWLSRNGGYYSIKDNNLYYNYMNSEKVLLIQIELISGVYHKSGHLFITHENINGANKLDIFIDGENIYSGKEIFDKGALINNEMAYGLKKTGINKYELICFNLETSEITYLDKIVNAGSDEDLEIDVYNQTIIIYSESGLEMSLDGGESWSEILNGKDLKGITPYVYKNEIFVVHGDALLHSYDGELWENVLDVLDNGQIMNFEFDLQNRILVYTSNGTFRSKEPVGVEENTQSLADIDINIYPNPATDQVNIESNENISGIEIYNLSGELLQTQSSLTVDTTELPGGTYFIKMQIGGKSVYKQIIIER